MKFQYMIVSSVVLLFAVLTSCRENKFGEVDLRMPEDKIDPVVATYTYNHPCAMFNQADFDRVKTSLDNGTAPQAVKDEFANLKNSQFTMLNYEDNPQTLIVRGDASNITSDGKENYAPAMRDAAAAYQMALLWKLTGNDAYANLSVKILDDWAAICTEIKSNDANQMLAAGCQGYTFANAAEIMQTYDGWSTSKKTIFKNWMKTVFAAKNKQFLDYHMYTCDFHYWSNWDLVNLCSYFAIGVLCEDNDMVNFVVNYFYTGAGNGCIKNLVQGTFTDPLGTGETICQDQESGRDQGHAMMSVAVAANLCQMAYTLYQSNTTVSQLDFFAAEDNALMKLGEYTALFNLRNGTDALNATGSWLVSSAKMPFNEYKYCLDCSCKDKNHGADQTIVADDAGRGSLRPGWEIIYNHYAKIKGLTSGFTYAQKAADKMRPEGGVGDGTKNYGTNSGAFDQLGWGTLMLYR